MARNAVAWVLVALMLQLVARSAPSGDVDLQGFWTNGTATPLERPADFAAKAFFTETEAAEFERTALDRIVKTLPPEDQLAADLTDVYYDNLKVVPDRRTSLIVDPADGRLPPMLPQARIRAANRPKRSYEDPETMSLTERCILSTAIGSSNASPPMIPNPLSENFYQIVQTADAVVIYTEFIHDARIIRLRGGHLPPMIRAWLGDSVGRWDGDTLVVDTTNFTDKTHFRGSSERLHVVERFRRTDANTLQYRVTVEDPETWARPWTAEVPFTATNQPVFEYACHEGNYSMVNTLRGAKAREKDR